MRHKIEVKCYAGYRGNERPTSFTYQDKIFRVIKIPERSIEESTSHGERISRFQVLADDNKVYQLLFNNDRDEWYLEGEV